MFNETLFATKELKTTFGFINKGIIMCIHTEMIIAIKMGMFLVIDIRRSPVHNVELGNKKWYNVMNYMKLYVFERREKEICQMYRVLAIIVDHYILTYLLLQRRWVRKNQEKADGFGWTGAIPNLQESPHSGAVEQEDCRLVGMVSTPPDLGLTGKRAKNTKAVTEGSSSTEFLDQGRSGAYTWSGKGESP